jgi:hypothetical protein
MTVWQSPGTFGSGHPRFLSGGTSEPFSTLLVGAQTKMSFEIHSGTGLATWQFWQGAINSWPNRELQEKMQGLLPEHWQFARLVTSSLVDWEGFRWRMWQLSSHGPICYQGYMQGMRRHHLCDNARQQNGSTAMSQFECSKAWTHWTRPV